MKYPKTAVFFLLLALLALWLYVAGREPPRTAVVLAPLKTLASPGAILVIGGTHGSGLEIVRILRARGDEVTVFARPRSNTAVLEKLGAHIARGDAMNPADLAAACRSANFRAVVSTLGTRGKDRPRPDFIGNRNAIDAARAAGIRRFVLVTVIGAGDSAGVEPWLAGRFLREIIALKTQAEDHLRGSGLEWTIIRPGGLIEKSAQGTAVLTSDLLAFSWITRGDLARLTVQALDDPQTVNHTYHAFDPARTRFWSLRENGDGQ